MLAKKLNNVVRCSSHAIANAIARGLCSKILFLKRRADGHQSPNNFETVIYFP